MQISEQSAGRVDLIASVAKLWDQDCLCDLTVKSCDGSVFNVHRVILAAASAPLNALLTGRFAESAQAVVSLDVSSQALSSILAYIYHGATNIRLEDVPEVLSFAHMYCLGSLQTQLLTGVQQHLNPSFAVRLLVECDHLALDELEEQCQRCVVEHFEESVKSEYFASLSVAMLGRILKKDALNIPSEEVVLQSVLKWRAADSLRDSCCTLLLQNVRFPLMAWRSLLKVEQLAEKGARIGPDLQREARLARKVHCAGRALEDLDLPVAKRRCLPYWWAELGASTGGSVVVNLEQDHGVYNIHLDSDHLILSVLEQGCVMRCALRDASLERIGPAADGAEDWGHLFVAKADSDGKLYVLRIDRDCKLWCYANQGGELLSTKVCDSPWVDFCITADGELYGITKHHIRDGNQEIKVTLPTESSSAIMRSIHVTDSGAVYVVQCIKHCVMRFTADSPVGEVVAGGNGVGDGMHQLDFGSVSSTSCRICVDKQGGIYIADTGNHRVMKWMPGACAGVVVAGGNGKGLDRHQLSDPMAVALDNAGSIYVLDNAQGYAYNGSRRIIKTGHRITRWSPSSSSDFELDI